VTDTTLTLDVERPVAGGWMLARHEGRVIFVAGAIPGERVVARIERTARQNVWARAVEVLEASPDRREPTPDPACGGLAFAHIAYGRQRALKAEILADAFRRVARIEVDLPAIAGSPETGYRMRARLHVRAGRVGFFREGTHEICDAAGTGQLHPGAAPAAEALARALGPRLSACDAITVAESADASARVLHVEPREGARLDDVAVKAAVAAAAGAIGVTGVTTVARGRIVTLDGVPTVTDTSSALCGAGSGVDLRVQWTRHATSFFQGNRHLTGALVERVVALAAGERCADLYAGVGLFAVPLAARGTRILAVEADRSAGADLATNAAIWGKAIHIERAPVEAIVAEPPMPPPDVVVVDPPRSGASRAAIEGVAAWGAPRVVYVSCDPPTLARDAARLIAAGYLLSSLEGFDLFPNTPHVEAVAVFDRAWR
jgi:23S rRNA (uracil1939-C5)-methyltransferase